MTAPQDTTRDTLLDAALNHVPFDGWSEATFRAAIADSGIDPTLAHATCPRGAVDLALAFHARGDQMMLNTIRASDTSGLKYSEKVAAAVRARLEVPLDKEAVRRGTTLFSLPQNSAAGARAIWNTADLIWTELGDTSDDFNWYSKRAILSSVISATVLYWLGDESPAHQNSWDFLDRRIANVMQFEKLKAGVNKNPLLRPFMAGPNWLMKQVRAPVRTPDLDLPGKWRMPDPEQQK